MATLAVVCGFAHGSTTVPSGPENERFLVRKWGVADGLPGNGLNAIAQDGHGFLWLGTFSGLVRFDGRHFVVYNEASGALPNGRITAVHAGRDGQIWAGAQGHVIHVGPQGMQVVATDPEGDWINALVQDRTGRVWVARTPPSAGPAALARIEGGQYVPVSLPTSLTPIAEDYDRCDSDRPPGGALPNGFRYPIVHLGIDEQGEVSGFVLCGRRFTIRDGALSAGERTLPGLLPFATRDLKVRVAQAEGSIEIQSTTSDERYRVTASAAQPIAVWLVDRQQRLWISRLNALEVYTPNRSQPLATWSLSTEIKDLIEDREGTIWIATSTEGLMQVQASPVRGIGPDQNLPLADALELTDDGMALLAPVVNFSPDSRAENNCSRFYALRHDAAPEERLRCQREVVGTQHGRVQINAPSQFGLPSTNPASATTFGEWLGSDPLNAKQGWVSDAAHLMLLSAEHAKALAEWPLPAQTAPMADADGVYWFGGTGGLQRIDGAEWTNFDRSAGLPVNDVRAVLPARRGGLWVGTYGGGLVYANNGQFRALTSAQGLMEDVVSGLERDRYGALWMAGNRGIQRVLEQDLEAFLDGTTAQIPALLIDQRDGLSNPETTGPRSLVQDAEGMLWFSTFGGTVMVDPSVMAATEMPSVEPILLQGSRPWPRAPDDPIILPSDSRQLNVQLAAIHLAAPETLRFRYRLSADAPWTTVDDSWSIDDLTLTDAGSYSLDVQARHSGGPWYGLDQPIEVTALPRLSETVWFKLSMLLALAALLLIAARMGSLYSRKRADALERLVAERTQELAEERDRVSRQADKLNALAEGRAHFISGISHELRTPLTLILGPLQELYRRLAGEMSGKDRDQLSTARRNAEWMLGLVERLLETARFDSELMPLHVQQTPISELVTELIVQLESAYEAHGCELDWVDREPPLTLWLDPTLIRSALINLLVNPLRHCPAGTRVTCRLKVLEEQAQIEVRDTGPGIPATALPHLFERFYRSRAGQAVERASGYGLGLWMVKQVAERHGGRVSVSSGPQGTCFQLSLPRGRDHLPDDAFTAADAGHAVDALIDPMPSWPTAPLTIGAEPGQDAPLILVIDDNEGIRHFVAQCLSERFHVIEAVDGEPGLALARQRLPDIILSDVMMPGLDGLEICRQLRSDPETDYLAIILLTARGGTDNRIEGLEQGADAYLTKPFDRRELDATIDRILESRLRLRRRLEADLLIPTPEDPGLAELLDRCSAADHDLIERCWACIAQQLSNEDFSVSELAAALHMSRASLYRKLKDACELTPTDLIREVRLQHARRLLAEQEGSISEVAYAVGYRSLAHFSNAVLQRFGRRPSAMRSPIHDSMSG